ncbi:MAG: Type II site-specific deoxyribonuclease [archaeon GW2011_AR13]|nr:MAG: Type II site-specific deoxyribonuclease [archaeon GW2011_AR13]HIG94424.1 restriction endonuclease [Nanoarchaeota archaeon]HIH62934.1 restriction endonuclease [Nanoarchaeota archaeon]HIJ10369.1 restriction endonuclease [Nanoarchaeota archaeon]
MNLEMYQKEVLQNYKRSSQITRVLTEDWFNREMYCPCCLNEKVKNFPNNQKGSDFFCEKCKNEFQLKASKKEFKNKIIDGDYKTMINIISTNNSPNFFLMNYQNNDWVVKNLILIPKFFINTSMIERKNISYPKGRTNGWVGCNFLLKRLPNEGRINLIQNEKIIDKFKVNAIWKKMFFMNSKRPEFKGWTSDVLKCIEELDYNFELKDIYKYENYLRELHPNNHNIQAKIRQQLQILRDNKILNFTGEGKYQRI